MYVGMYVCVCHPCPLARDEANNYVSCVRHGMCIASSLCSPIFFSTLKTGSGLGTRLSLVSVRV